MAAMVSPWAEIRASRRSCFWRRDSTSVSCLPSSEELAWDWKQKDEEVKGRAIHEGKTVNITHVCVQCSGLRRLWQTQVCFMSYNFFETGLNCTQLTGLNLPAVLSVPGRQAQCLEGHWEFQLYFPAAPSALSAAVVGPSIDDLCSLLLKTQTHTKL